MNDSILYCGPEADFYALEKRQEQATAMVMRGDTAPVHKPFDQQGAVAVVDVSGSLVNGHAGFMSFFGATGYADIRDSLVAAISDSSIGSILLNIDSGGGHVAGVHELAQLISRVDKVKPVVAYTGGTMASAALWLGSSARHTVAAETAMVGSVGILQVHIDRTEQMKQDGIKATVIRAGADKALANPYEPLSDKAKAMMEDQAQAMYSVFLGHVAEQKNLPIATAEKKFGGGRMFVGQQIADAGLADKIGSYEAAFSKATQFADKTLGKGKTPSNMPNVRVASVVTTPMSADNAASQPTTEPVMDPKNLSPEALAALAAGVELGEPVAAVEPAPAVPAAAEPVAAVPAPVAVPVVNELVAHLQASLDKAQADVLAAKMEAKAAVDSLATIKSQFDASVEIARASVRTMTVALRGKVDAVASMSAAEVLAAHASVAEQFKAQFKAGPVAATAPEGGAPVKVASNPLFAALLQSRQK